MSKQTYMLTSLEFFVYKMDLTTLLAQLIQILRAKLWKKVTKCENFLTFGPFFSKRTLRLRHLFLA